MSQSAFMQIPAALIHAKKVCILPLSRGCEWTKMFQDSFLEFLGIKDAREEEGNCLMQTNRWDFSQRLALFS